MYNTDNSREQPVHISGDIWLSPQPLGRRPDGSVNVNVCLRAENGLLAAMEMLILSPDGVYSLKEKTIGTIDSAEFAQYIKKFQNVPDVTLLENRTYSQNEEALFEQTRSTYAETKSIKKTAKILKISEEKARRILFTTGDYTCETHEKVMELLKKGISLDEISSTVGLSRHKIRAYLPYG